MKVIILHSALVESSRNLMAELGVDPQLNEDIITAPNGWQVCAKHSYAVTVCPNFSAYPTCVVIDAGGQMRVKSPVGSLADCEAFTNDLGNPGVKTIFTPFEFSQRFTFAEQVAIETAGETDASVRVVMRQFQTAQDIDLDNQACQQGVMLLASKGLLTTPRAVAILAP